MAEPRPDATGTDSGVLSSSAVMAAGTVVSRLSGFLRSALLAAALGPYLHAELFTIANTIPNMLYILLAGGVFNAVLVPQLIRAMRNHPDGGEAYTNRVITLAALFLAGVSAVLVIGAPLVMRVFLSGAYFDPSMAPERESVIAFARYCLPQVFFYGMFVLVGQILNARGRFGPMMWAPIANNVIAVAVLGTYLLVFGPAQDLYGPYTGGQELLLGLGSTAGIVLQLVVLVPYLKAAGFTFRPRFDFRDAGLGHTLRLGIWTVLFVVVNQIAYTVVVRIASGGAAAGPSPGQDPGTGYTVYTSTFLLVMVPHSVATVSLATAVLPRLSGYAADADMAALGRALSSTMRTALALVIPFVALLPVIAYDLSDVVFGWLAAANSVEAYAPTLAMFAPGLLFFTIHYLMLRGFYALERTRTVFWVQCVVALVNVSAAFGLTRSITADQTAPRLVLAYAAAYAVGAATSYTLLRRTVGGLETPTVVRFLVRTLVATALATAAAGLSLWLLHTAWPGNSKPQTVLALVLGVGVDAVVFWLVARRLRITEVTSVVALVSRRIPTRRKA